MSQLLGIYLRELRAARGVGLDEVARATRVGRRYLEALESDSLAELPAPVFTKGYIRAYCRALGEPPDEALARYGDMVSANPATTPPARPARSAEWRGGSLLVSLALLVMFGAGLLVFTLSVQSRAPRVLAPPAAPASPRSVPPIGAAGSLRSSATPHEAGAVRLVARTSEQTWIRVETDDQRLAEETLPPGTTREWVSPNRFILTIGNAGGITLELNGRPVPPLGPRGAVIRKLVLPPEAGAPKP